jgi:hypothetical protein
VDIDALLDEAEVAEANGEPLPLGLDDASNAAKVTLGTVPLQNGKGKVTTAEDDLDVEEDGEIVDDEAPNTNEARQPTAEEREAALRRAGLAEDDLEPPNEDAAGTTSAKQPSQVGAASTAPPPPDQILENVKMAYYWAGYYSGLYDGQRQLTATGQGGSTSNGVP